MPSSTINHHRNPATTKVVGMRVDQTSYEAAVQQIMSWTGAEAGRYVCVANVHMVMEACDDPHFSSIVEQADLVTPDGMPLVWMLRKLGSAHQERVYGPELMVRVLAAAAENRISVGFIGGTQQTLDKLTSVIQAAHSELTIGFVHSPPFRELTGQEEEQLVKAIQQSGIQILFVGLGCPKQERWMAAHKDVLSVVMLGVGAAFDFHAGTKKQAPLWMRKAGLEWFFRFMQEPARLWKRYVLYNPRFILLAFAQLLRRKQ